MSVSMGILRGLWKMRPPCCVRFKNSTGTHTHSHDVGASNGMSMSILLLLRFKVICIRSRQDGTSSRWTSMANYRHPVVSGEVTGLMIILCLPVVVLPTHVSCCVQERSPDNQLILFPLVVSFEVSCPVDT